MDTLLGPSYAGIVRVTQQAQSEWQALLPELVDTWETTIVEFKRELSLRTKAEKAEFVRDFWRWPLPRPAADRC